MKYYRRNTEVSALQWRKGNTAEVLEFLGIPPTNTQVDAIRIGPPDTQPNATVTVLSPGHWVVEHSDGAVRVFTDETFHRLYAPIISAI